jgi:hypothetical protein
MIVKNRIQNYIESLEVKNFQFKPNPDFYENVGIKRKRFAQLCRNEKPATLEELTNIAAFFNCKVVDLIQEQP